MAIRVILGFIFWMSSPLRTVNAQTLDSLAQLTPPTNYEASEIMEVGDDDTSSGFAQLVHSDGALLYFFTSDCDGNQFQSILAQIPSVFITKAVDAPEIGAVGEEANSDLNLDPQMRQYLPNLSLVCPALVFYCEGLMFDDGSDDPDNPWVSQVGPAQQGVFQDDWSFHEVRAWAVRALEARDKKMQEERVQKSEEAVPNPSQDEIEARRLLKAFYSDEIAAEKAKATEEMEEEKDVLTSPRLFAALTEEGPPQPGGSASKRTIQGFQTGAINLMAIYPSNTTTNGSQLF